MKATLYILQIYEHYERQIYVTNIFVIIFTSFLSIQQCIEQKYASPEACHLFRGFSQFLEVMYDPYLTWRSFLRNNFADYRKLSYKPHMVHVEIIPFIYGKLQSIFLEVSKESNW